MDDIPQLRPVVVSIFPGCLQCRAGPAFVQGGIRDAAKLLHAISYLKPSSLPSPLILVETFDVGAWKDIV